MTCMWYWTQKQGMFLLLQIYICVFCVFSCLFYMLLQFKRDSFLLYPFYWLLFVQLKAIGFPMLNFISYYLIECLLYEFFLNNLFPCIFRSLSNHLQTGAVFLLLFHFDLYSHTMLNNSGEIGIYALFLISVCFYHVCACVRSYSIKYYQINVYPLCQALPSNYDFSPRN